MRSIRSSPAGGRAARAFAARVYRLDQRRELLPRHHPVHLRQKLLAAGGLAVTLKAGCGERFLLRARHSVIPPQNS
jgi:hypothetical protein